MKVLRQEGRMTLYQIEDGKLSVFDGNLELNHYSPSGEPLGEGRYGADGQKSAADTLAKNWAENGPDDVKPCQLYLRSDGLKVIRKR